MPKEKEAIESIQMRQEILQSLPWSLLVPHNENDLDYPGIDTRTGDSIVISGNDSADTAGIQGENRDQAWARANFIIEAVNAYQTTDKSRSAPQDGSVLQKASDMLEKIMDGLGDVSKDDMEKLYAEMQQALRGTQPQLPYGATGVISAKITF